MIQNLKGKGIKVVSLELTNSSRMYNDLKENDFPLCLILGNELTGVSQELIEQSDFALEIPQFGYKHSMNVSVAFGIAVFELVRFLNLK